MVHGASSGVILKVKSQEQVLSIARCVPKTKQQYKRGSECIFRLKLVCVGVGDLDIFQTDDLFWARRGQSRSPPRSKISYALIQLFLG